MWSANTSKNGQRLSSGERSTVDPDEICAFQVSLFVNLLPEVDSGSFDAQWALVGTLSF